MACFCKYYMRFLIYLLISLVYASLSFLLSSINSVYSLLFLICLFLLGTILLFLMNVTFLALVFFMIYIGAIVVLFLFVIMMLDVKTSIIQKSSLQQAPISLGNLALLFIFIEFLLLIFEDISVIDLLNTFDTLNIIESSFTFWVEHIDFFEIFQNFTKNNQVQIIGQSMYRFFLYPFLLGGLILFIAMVGAIVLSVEEDSFYKVKMQNASLQSMKQPNLRYAFFS